MSSNFLKIYKGTTYAPQDTTPSNPVDGDIYYDSVLNKFRGYQNGSWQDLITDGADGINYILNPGAEAGADGYVAYADAAATSPVDGIGGSPSFVTWARTTTASEILRQDASFKLTKSSGNAQGEGVAYDFSIDPRDKEDDLQISFDFKNLDSNYENGDLKIFVYDVDNSILIGNVSNDEDGDVLVAPTEGGSFYGEIRATDSVNYRLIFHIAGTTSANWALSIDRIKVGPVQAFVHSLDVREEIIDVTGSGAFTGGTIRVSRTGNQVTIQTETELTFPAQSTPTSAAEIIPEWARPDITRWNLYINNGANYVARANVTAAGAFAVDFSNWDGSDDATETGDSAFMSITYAVAGGSNLVSSTQLQQQTIKANMYLTADQTILTAGQKSVEFDASEFDTHNIFDSSTGSFVIPRTGFYNVHVSLNLASITTDERIRLSIRSNGSAVGQILYRASVTDTPAEISKLLKLNKGDVIDVILDPDADANYLVRSGSGLAYATIESLPDYTTYGVSKNPVPAARAIMSATQNIVTTATTRIEFDSVDFDTHEAWDTVNYEYEVPENGVYAMNYALLVNNHTAGNNLILSITVNGVVQKYHRDTNTGGNPDNEINFVYKLNKGDLVAAQIENIDGNYQAGGTQVSRSYFGIYKVTS